MQDLFKDAAVEVAELLKRFSFDLDGLTAEQLVFNWLAQYPGNWVRLSLVEALYQGRYKAVSVEQILRFWQRRGQPFYHFNYEFERIIRGRFSRNLLPYSTAVAPHELDQTRVLVENNTSSQTLNSKVTRNEETRNEEVKTIETLSDADHEISESDRSPSLSKSPEPEEFLAIVDTAVVAAIIDTAIIDTAVVDTAVVDTVVEAVAVVSAADPSSDEATADLLTFTGVMADVAAELSLDPAESAIQPFSDRLKILSSEESIAFLKLRSFENDTPFHSQLKDAPIQTFSPVSEFETVDKPKWARLAIGSSADESSPEESPTEHIHQFVPGAVSSADFYSKLKAVASEANKSSEGETDL